MGTWHPLAPNGSVLGGEVWVLGEDGSASRRLGSEGALLTGTFRYDPRSDLGIVTVHFKSGEEQQTSWRLLARGRARIIRWRLGAGALELRHEQELVREGSEAWRECLRAAKLPPDQRISCDPAALTPGASYILARATALHRAERARAEKSPLMLRADERVKILERLERNGVPWYRVRVARPGAEPLEGWIAVADLIGQPLERAR